MSDVMQLAKTLDITNDKAVDRWFNSFEGPAIVSKKIDGVPMLVNIGSGVGWTRQGKHTTPSVSHIITAVSAFRRTLYNSGVTAVIGEVHIPDTPFKDISGKFRKCEPCLQLELNIFDVLLSEEYTGWGYADRMDKFYKLWKDMPFSPWIKVTGFHVAYDPVSVQTLANGLLKPNVEGVICRPLNGEFHTGKSRTKQFVKYKPKPTVDLKVHSYEEAISQDGEPKGMVGRINCWYKGNIIGVGPGKMTHAERSEAWERTAEMCRTGMDQSDCDMIPTGVPQEHTVIEVGYMRDPSYSALREARFLRFRNKEVNEDG